MKNETIQGGGIWFTDSMLPDLDNPDGEMIRYPTAGGDVLAPIDCTLDGLRVPMLSRLLGVATSGGGARRWACLAFYPVPFDGEDMEGPDGCLCLWRPATAGDLRRVGLE